MKMFIKNLLTDKKINSKQQAQFLLTISKLLGNGFSLSQSINCLRLLENKHDVFEKIHQDLQNGAMISQALRHLQLPDVIFNQIVIAQNHGKIDQTLMQTGILLQSQAQQKNKLKELLVYPSFILMFLLIIFLNLIKIKIMILLFLLLIKKYYEQDLKKLEKKSREGYERACRLVRIVPLPMTRVF